MIRALLVIAALAATARADDGADVQAQTTAQPDSDSPWPTIEATGTARLRAGYLYNLDLDRGLTPSGYPLFPVPDANEQTVAARDVRLRTDLVARSRGGTVELRARLDILDDVGLDGTSFDAVSRRVTDTGDTIKIRRAYGAVLTPVGVVIAGRTGNQFGLGMVANPGDCLDCDGGDAADRIGLVTPVRGYIVATAVDLASSENHFTAKPLDPRDSPHAATFAVMRWHGDNVRAIRRRDGRTTVDYGGAAVYVWQERDTPADYLLPSPGPMPATIARGLSGLVASGWVRIETHDLRIEAESAFVDARIAQGSLVPGLLLRHPVGMRQHGAAFESDYGAQDARFAAGFDAGYASGDPAPGFGAFPSLANASAAPGDLEGSQVRPASGDYRIDNFRFNPNYRIDQILFRQIIGTVTDAVYVRPHVRVKLTDLGSGALAIKLAAVASWAIDASSTPSGQRTLGLEFDTTLAYSEKHGFVAQLVHGVLFPGAAFDSTMLAARPAQTFELLGGYSF